MCSISGDPMKITIVDIFVIILVGLSLFSFYSKYDFNYKSSYSGSQIEDAIQECDFLDSLGVLYTVYVKGHWNLDIGHFEEEAFVINTQKECLTIILKNGRTVTIGKPKNYKTDVQASNIEIYIKSKSSVIYQFKSVRGSKKEILNYIENSSRFITYEREDISLNAIFLFYSDIRPSLLLESEIEDELRRTIFFMKGADVEIYPNELMLSVERLSIKEIEKVFEILEKHCFIKDISVGEIVVIYQAAQEIDAEDISILESYEGGGVYEISVYGSLEHNEEI